MVVRHGRRRGRRLLGLIEFSDFGGPDLGMIEYLNFGGRVLDVIKLSDYRTGREARYLSVSTVVGFGCD